MALPPSPDSFRIREPAWPGSIVDLGNMATWQIALRWLVPPAILVGVAVSRGLGLEFDFGAVLAVAGAILVYNAGLHLVATRWAASGTNDGAWVRKLNLAQVALDYAATFALVHFTGGATSPLVLFFVFHVISTAILFPPAAAWAFAAFAVVGLVVLTAARAAGALPPAAVSYYDRPIVDASPQYVVIWLGFLGATFLISAGLSTAIMARLRHESERAQEAVRAGVAERTQFMLRVAHNLRAPLGAAVSMLSLIDQGYLGTVTAEQKAYLMRVGSRLEGLDSLVSELLILARGREPGAHRPHERVLPADLARRIDETFTSAASRKSVTLGISCRDGAPTVLGDAEMLAQVVENLVSNAVKYTPEGGTVSVEFGRSAGGELEVIVRDSGIGIPAAEQDRLFTEFFRASNARQFEAVGTGLGLAIVKQVVDRHRGRVEFESSEGAGSLFRVLLPAEPDPRSTGAA